MGCLWYLPTLEFGLMTFMGIIQTLKLNKLNFALLVHCVLDAISNDFLVGNDLCVSTFGNKSQYAWVLLILSIKSVYKKYMDVGKFYVKI